MIPMMRLFDMLYLLCLRFMFKLIADAKVTKFLKRQNLFKKNADYNSHLLLYPSRRSDYLPALRPSTRAGLIMNWRYEFHIVVKTISLIYKVSAIQPLLYVMQCRLLRIYLSPCIDVYSIEQWL